MSFKKSLSFSSSFLRTDFSGIFGKFEREEMDNGRVEEEEEDDRDGLSHLIEDEEMSENVPVSTLGGRRRHFSLEDYSNGEDTSNDSSSISLFGHSNTLPTINHNDDEFKFHISSLIPEEGMSIDMASHFICSQVMSEFEEKLRQTLESTSRKIVLPDGLLSVIAKHVLSEGSQEPCGLKGCRVNIHYEGYSDIQFLGTLICDPGTVPTFQLTLTLRQSPKSWGHLLRRQSMMFVSTSYKLVKRCLYREEPEVPMYRS